jgi:D-galactose 1-dehydrogenase
MLAKEPSIQTVVICTPPDIRWRIALDAIAAGKHVLLEKPPFSTLGDFRRIRLAAERAGVTVMGVWHCQFNLAVDRARDFLAHEEVAKLNMIWDEDVAVTHPGQNWIWGVGGFGVFDNLINGISILTKILREPLVVRAATLWVPKGAQGPVSVEIDFAAPRDEDQWHARSNWRAPGPDRTLEIVTRSGHRLWMPKTCRCLELDGTVLIDEENLEYPRIYDRFAQLIDSGKSDLDERPLTVVADCYLIGNFLPA